MSDNKSANGPSWWQTLPGILTGLAAIITAVTGLIIAFNRTGSRSEPVSSSSPPPVSRDAQPATTTESPSAGPIPLPPLHEVKLAAGAAVVTILSAQVAPIDAARRTLTFDVRYRNAGRYPANFWSSSYRLIVADVPREPTNLLDEVVAPDSAKEGEVVFDLPRGAKDVTLQISAGDEKTRLPFRLP
jgi:hypothetical protein